MEKNTEKQEFEFSLVSFLRIFKGKLKMLIAIGLVSAIIGGTAGVLVSLLGKKTYGNLLAFYFLNKLLDFGRRIVFCLDIYIYL